MKVGILTGGGDVPGLNPCIKAATLRALEEGHEVVGIRRGWAGLLETDVDDPDSITRNITPLDAGTVRTIDRSGGTVLHTSRTNPARGRPSEEPEFLRSAAREHLEDLGVEIRTATRVEDVTAEEGHSQALVRMLAQRLRDLLVRPPRLDMRAVADDHGLGRARSRSDFFTR